MTDETVTLPDFSPWIGRSESSSDTITPQLVRRFRATFDEPAGELATGTPAPIGLHWCLAPPAVPQSEIGEDGHPARGGFLPPVPLPRRMWAGGRLAFHGEMRIGDEVERLSTVKAVTAKQGRTGLLCFVLVEHRLSTARGLACIEEHDIVYRGVEAPASGAGGTVGEVPLPDLSRTVDPDPVLLFRYSALTFNGHRIHYDRRYVTEVEHYPGLIVHGPLQATLLMRLAAEAAGEAPLAGFSFRALRPLFDGAPVSANVRRGGPGEEAELWIASPAGIHMRAQARW